MVFHKPILVKEAIEGLHIVPDGVYVDMTYGGGGHSGEILKALGGSGRLVAFDQDEDACRNAKPDPRFTLIRSNFRYAGKHLRLLGLEKINGVLADLGVSSHQFDAGERGFSYRYDASLDMRMNQRQDLTAQWVLNRYDERDLLRIFSEYGEVRNSKELVRHVLRKRAEQEIRTTGELERILQPVIRGDRQRYLAQVFQALRIEVNGELRALEEMLESVGSLLFPGGRLVVLTFHSIEDRIVKRFIRTGNTGGIEQKDLYGVIHRPFRDVVKGVIEASAEECRENPRANSAKLRIAEKI